MIIKRVTGVVTTLIIILSVLIFLPNPLSQKIKRVFILALKYPLTVSEISSKNLTGFLGYKNILRENRRLKKELELLKAKLTQLEEAQLENTRLYKVLDFKEKFPLETVACQVIGRDPSNWFNTIIINKGKNDGIKEGTIVLNFAGLVGRVIETHPAICKVMLITDPSSKVAAKIQRTRDEAVLEGVYKDLCRMKYLPLESKILEGDKVITSGHSQIYPEGLLIGEVVNISKDPSNLYKIALIRPEAELLKLEEVLCIKGKSSF